MRKESISIRNRSSGKSFVLIPRWECSAPQPEAVRELIALGEPAASLPASEDTGLRLAPSLTEVNDLIFSSVMTPHASRSVPLAQCSSFDPGCLQPVEGNLYVNLKIYPHDGRAILRLYEVHKGQMIWISTGFYFLAQISTDIEDEVASDKYPAQMLENKPIHYHGKASVDVSLPPLKVKFDRDFTVEGRIGQGTEGTVCQCSSIFGSYSSAIKMIDLGNLFITSAACEPREVSMFSLLSHDNIVAPYLAWHEASMSRYTSTVGCAFISMELCDRSLEQYLNEREEIDLESNVHIFKQILEVLKFMHENGVMHRDIKPANILLESDLTVKLIDFGIAKRTAKPAVGAYASLPYCAPELGNSCTTHDERVDIFAAGIVYCELFLPCRKKHHQGKSRWSKARAEQSQKKLMLLAQKIRELARELDIELLGRRFNLDDAVHGTEILENWRGDLAILKRMISPRPNERQSAVELLDLFDKDVPDNKNGGDGSGTLGL